MHAFLFPGQGAQAIGMGKDLAENFLVAKNVFEEVNDALNQDLSALIWDGDIYRVERICRSGVLILRNPKNAIGNSNNHNSL